MFENDKKMSKAMEWCAKARELLGLLRKGSWTEGGGYKHGQRMATAIKELGIELTQALRETNARPEGDRKQELLAAYEVARTELLAIGKLAKAASTKQSNEMAQIASDRLSVLQYSVATKFFKDPDGSAAKSLLEAEQRLTNKIEKYRLRYEERLLAAEKARKTLFVLNLPGQVVPYEQPVVEAMAAARRLAVLLAHGEAISVLDGVEDLVKTQQAKAQADQLLRTAAARDKPVFDAQRRVISAGLEKIKAVPGTKVQQQGLTDALRQADALAKDPVLKYREAFETLRNAEGLLETAKSAGESFAQGVDKPLQGKFSLATQKLAAFKATFGLGQADAVATLDTDLKNVLVLMDSQPQQVGPAGLALDRILMDIQNKTGSAGQDKQRYDQALQGARQLLADVEARTTLDVYQPLLSDFRAASAEYAAQQYRAAADKLDAFVVQATQARQTANPDFEAWGRMLMEINATYFDVLEQAAALPLNGSQGASGLMTSFIQARDFFAGQRHDFAKALQVGADLKDKVDRNDETGLRKRVNDYAALAQKRQTAQSAIEAAQLVIQQLKDAGCDEAGFSSQLNQLTRPWFVRCQDTLDGDEIDTALGTLTQGLDALKLDVQKLLRDDPSGTLQASKDTATNKQQAAAFKARQAEVETLVHQMEQEGLGGAPALRQQLQLAQAMPESERVAALQALTQTAEAAAQQWEQHQQAVAKARREALVLGQQFVNEAQQLKSKNSDLGKACDALLNRVNALLGLADSSVLAIVQDGKDALSNFRSSFNDQVKAITDIVDKLAALAELLKDPLLGKHLPGRKALLAARLAKEMPGRCASDPSKALVPLLSGFEAEIISANEAAASAATWKLETETIAKRIDEQLKQLGEAPALQKAFQARLAAARKPAEGRELGARQDAEALEQLVAATLSKPDLLAQMEQGAKQAEAESAQAQSSFEAQVEIFKLRELKAASDLHSSVKELLGLSKRNEALYKQMQQAFDDAQGLAKAGEHLRALDQLGRARSLAQQYADNPDGGKAASTRQLQQAVDGWRKTVAGFVGSMNGLVANVKTRCDTDDAYKGSIDAFSVALRRVALAFDAGTFDNLASQLDQAKDDLAKRRTAKEEGLRHLRRFQEVMAQDPVFAMVGESPFGAAPVQQLKARARALEVNLKQA